MSHMYFVFVLVFYIKKLYRDFRVSYDIKLFVRIIVSMKKENQFKLFWKRYNFHFRFLNVHTDEWWFFSNSCFYVYYMLQTMYLQTRIRSIRKIRNCENIFRLHNILIHPFNSLILINRTYQVAFVFYTVRCLLMI